MSSSIPYMPTFSYEDEGALQGYQSRRIFFSNFHFNNISTNYNYTSHYIRQCTIGCHSGTKIVIIINSLD